MCAARGAKPLWMSGCNVVRGMKNTLVSCTQSAVVAKIMDGTTGTLSTWISRCGAVKWEFNCPWLVAPTVYEAACNVYVESW